MRDTAAYRSFVAHLNIANALRALRQQWTHAVQQVRRFQLVVSRSCADQDLIAIFTDVGERFDTRNIYEQLRLRETQLHGRYQTVPTGKHLRAIEIACEQCDCFIERRWSLV